jgi:lipopolysaccharide biosynthesis protein
MPNVFKECRTVTDNLARLIAFYLPQFHPIPENNEWWGKGFTEWTNITKARPLFPGHYQPHIPANLGFYDLRVLEARQAQADLAKAYGIEGFCYWHYWFEGKRLLERPFDEVLSSGRPDFPFCLAWANESWSRRWLGEDKEILQRQTYSFEDDLRHIRWLLKAFADPRYLQVQGRPLFMIYRPTGLPDPQRTTDLFRFECSRQGLPEPYLLGINSFCPHLDCRELGFDGTLDFEPCFEPLAGPMEDGLKIYDYRTARNLMMSRKGKYPYYPSIFVSWDNTPRRGQNGIVFINSGPEQFESGLKDVVQAIRHKPFDERLVFINAWNEWAEGNHLEPDLRYGLQYLQAIKRVNVVDES